MSVQRQAVDSGSAAPTCVLDMPMAVDGIIPGYSPCNPISPIETLNSANAKEGKGDALERLQLNRIIEMTTSNEEKAEASAQYAEASPAFPTSGTTTHSPPLCELGAPPPLGPPPSGAVVRGPSSKLPLLGCTRCGGHHVDEDCPHYPNARCSLHPDMLPLGDCELRVAEEQAIARELEGEQEIVNASVPFVQ